MRCDRRPSSPTNWRAALRSIMLGLNLAGFGFLNCFRSIDPLLIGWHWALGGIVYLAISAGLALTMPAYASIRRFGLGAIDKGLERLRSGGKADQA